MFTGIIEEIGTIKNSDASGKLTIEAEKVLTDVRLGDSISVNGICLTVTQFSKRDFVVDVMPQTLRTSSLGSLKKGSKVNLERAMRLGDRFGGHMVSGHIDGVGKISRIKDEGNATWVGVKTSEKLLRYIIEKGSIAIDGISLTVASIDNDEFSVSLIPFTKMDTTLLDKVVGDTVNLECDLIGKYVEKMMCPAPETKADSKVDMNFLRENGFL